MCDHARIRWQLIIPPLACEDDRSRVAYINPDLISISSQTPSSASHTPQYRTGGCISRTENPANRDAYTHPLGALESEKISSDWGTAVIDGPPFPFDREQLG